MHGSPSRILAAVDRSYAAFWASRTALSRCTRCGNAAADLHKGHCVECQKELAL